MRDRALVAVSQALEGVSEGGIVCVRVCVLSETETEEREVF